MRCGMQTDQNNFVRLRRWARKFGHTQPEAFSLTSFSTYHRTMKFSLQVFITILFLVSHIARVESLDCLAKWCSFEYEYQKKSCKWKFVWGIPTYSCTWRSTDYRWCVHKWGSEPANTYGEIEFWDDDRIKKIGNGMSSSGTKAQCGKRTDIGTGSCKQETIQLDLSEAWRC